MAQKILVVSHEIKTLNMLRSVLSEKGYHIVRVRDKEGAEKLITRIPFDAVICDLLLPEEGGYDVLRKSREIRPGTPVLIITTYDSLEKAVSAIRTGASDCIIKPFIREEIVFKVEKLFRSHPPVLESVLSAEGEADDDFAGSPIIGRSEAIQDLLAVIRKVSSSRGTVLITGESGTGKELVARTIHQRSPRRRMRFIPVNCGAIPETLLESILFGHLKGAFTGAMKDQGGVFEAADQGTLFLDEIADLPLVLQAKILRAIEEKAIYPLGATGPVPVDIRLIAATHQDLRERIREGMFREDLYYRLNVVEIRVPPLRDRSEDIPLLVDHFIGKYNRELNKDFRGVTDHALRILMKHPWRGNIRELENVIERGVVLGTPPFLGPEDLPFHLSDDDEGSSGADRDNLNAALRSFERRHIQSILQKTHHDKSKAAKLLGISLATLYRKLERRD